MRLLLISNSTNAGEAYLDYPKTEIRNFLGDDKITCLFIPFAGITISFDDYAKRVKARFREIGHDVQSIHTFPDPIEAVNRAEAIVVGGGNTWQLIKMMQDKGLIEAIKEKVQAGIPYIGWSAGSNVACPSIKTTNDMPVVEPASFNAIGLVKFQINPHYTDKNPEGHAGETREDRIMEFLATNKNTTVMGLREGCLFRIEGSSMRLIGPRTVKVFSYGKESIEFDSNADFSAFL